MNDTVPIWMGKIIDGKFIESSSILAMECVNANLELTREKDNIKRIRKILESTPITNKIHQIVKELSQDVSNCSRTMKSVSTSIKLRQEANEYYKGKQLASALRGFTLSLCFAPKDSPELFILAYSNRSACYLEMNEPHLSLEDIIRALLVFDNYHKESSLNKLVTVKEKLVERQKRCILKIDERNLSSKKSSSEFIKLSDYENFFRLKSLNKSIESSEDFVTIADDSVRGRYVKVTSNVSPGNVIILEKPFSKILLKQLKWELDFCHNCFKYIAKSLACVPCPTCVFAVYCNYTCQETHSEAHKYDCILAPYLHRLELQRLVLLSYRILTTIGPQGLYDFSKSEFLRKCNIQEQQSILGFQNGKYLSSNYLTINCLIHHESLTENEICRYCIDSIFITELIFKHTNFFQSIPKDKIEEFKYFAASLILLHQMNLPCNAHSLNCLKLSSLDPSAEEIQQCTTTEFGAGAFSLLSMINHSCDPNVTRITLSHGRNAVVTIRPLRAGEEILDNYGQHFALEDLETRRNHLQRNYNFLCNCIACTNAWPKLNVLQDKENRFVCSDCVKKLDNQRNHYESCVLVKGKCKQCGKFYELSILENDLANQINKFRDAFNLTIKNKPFKSIQNIIETLSYFESELLQPYIYTNFAQETLKQSLNLLSAYQMQMVDND